MKNLLLVGLLAPTLFGAAPVILDGPRVQVLQKNNFLVKWRTSEAPGATSSITCNLAANPTGAVDTCTVTPGDGPKFPVGSVVKIGRERLKISAQSGDTLTLGRGFDAEYERVWEGQLISVVSNGSTCTVNTSQPHYYTVGDSLRVMRMAPAGVSTSVTYTAATVPSSTRFTFSCAGSTPGTYNNAGLQVYQYPTAHSSGATITRIDSTGQVCYGTTSAYGAVFKAISFAFGPQSINHFVYVPALQPGTTYHWKVQSRTGQANGAASCSSPDGDTVQSVDSTTTTPTAVAGDQVPTPPSNDGRTWDFTDNPKTAFTTDVLAAADCSDLQAKINAAAAQDGNTDNRVRIPAAVHCGVNLTLPAKSGSNPTGTGKLVLETDAWLSLPSQGSRLHPAASSAFLPTLYTSIPTPVITLGSNASYWIIRGLGLTADPALATAAFGGDFPLLTSFTGGSDDYDIAVQPNHIALEQMWLRCPDYNDYCKGARLHGTYIAVMDSRVGPVFGANDQGAVQIDGYATQYVYTYNNDLTGAMSGYYQSDNSLTPKDTLIIRNYMHKPRQWNNRAAEYQFSAVQGVASATAGSPTTFVTTNQNDITNRSPVAFAGAAGNWTALNYTRWSVRDGTMNVTVVRGIATVTTSNAHGLSTGQYVSYGGGHFYPCSGFSAQGTAAAVTVSNATTFTFATSSADFSTTSGTQCQGSDIVVQGPVWYPTVVNPTTFTIPMNSAGFGPLAGSVMAGYPRSHNIKNAYEYKQSVRSLIQGNIIDGSWSELQSGQLMVMSVRGLGNGGGWPMAQGPLCWSCAGTISDVDIQQNILRNGCSGLHILGTDDLSITTPMYRVRAQGNLYQNLSATSSGTGTCQGAPMSWNGSYNDVTFDHNTVFNDSKVLAEDTTSSFPQSGKVYISSNIIDAANPMTNGSCTWAGLVNGLNASGCIPSFIDWLNTRNVFYGDASVGPPDPWHYARQYESGVTTGSAASYQANFWPDDQSGVGFVNDFTVDSATNTAPIVVHTTAPHDCVNGDVVRVMGANGNSNANGLWYVGAVTSQTLALAGSIGNGAFAGTASLVPWSGTCATIGGAALRASSRYVAGTRYVAPAPPPNYGTAGQGAAADNTDIGVNTAALTAAIGDLAFTSVTPAGNSATFAYTIYAGTGERCYIDTSSDSFSTLTRTPDSGTGTSRSTLVGNLTGNTTYSYRLMCPSAFVSGSFTTGSVTGCSFSLDPASATYLATGDSTLISITARAPDCEWSVGNVPDWMGFSPASGVGSRQTIARASTNSGPARSGSPTIADQIFSVAQAAGEIATVAGPATTSNVGTRGTTMH